MDLSGFVFFHIIEYFFTQILNIDTDLQITFFDRCMSDNITNYMISRSAQLVCSINLNGDSYEIFY